MLEFVTRRQPSSFSKTGLRKLPRPGMEPRPGLEPMLIFEEEAIGIVSLLPSLFFPTLHSAWPPHRMSTCRASFS